MDVTDRRRREIVIDDQVDTFEIDTTSHQLRANQDPDLTRPERLNNVVSLKERQILITWIMTMIQMGGNLKLRPFRVNDVNIYALVDQFSVQFLGSFLGLYKD